MRHRPMTDDQKEIERLKGELSAATACLGNIFELLALAIGDDMRDAFIRKINSRSFGPSDLLTDRDEWRSGVERFNERLTKHLTGDHGS